MSSSPSDSWIEYFCEHCVRSARGQGAVVRRFDAIIALLRVRPPRLLMLLLVRPNYHLTNLKF